MSKSVAGESVEIFISYRRQDSQGFAGRLSADLIRIFGDNAIFRDDEIRPGSDYTQMLEGALAQCTVLIVVIGRAWLNVTGPDGQPRIGDDTDWVRREIEAALLRDDVLVLPVLVGGAQMPAASALPQSLASLSHRQAHTLEDRRWDEDIEALAALISAHVPSLRYRAAARGRRLEASILTEALRDHFERDTKPFTPRSWSQRLLSTVGRGVKSLAVFLVVGLVAGFLLHEYGDEAMQRLPTAFLSYLRDVGQSIMAWLRT